MVIDFVGPSGSGKSTLSSSLSKRLGERSVLASDLRLTKFELITYCLLHPYQTVQSILFIKSTKPKGVTNFFKNLAILIIYQAKLEKLKKKNYKYIIFDEGLLHKLRQIRRRSKRTGLSYRNIKSSFRKRFFPFPDIVILVIPPLGDLLNRYMKCNAGIEKEKLIDSFETVDGSIEKSIQTTKDDVLAASKEHEFSVVKVTNSQDIPISNTINEVVKKL